MISLQRCCGSVGLTVKFFNGYDRCERGCWHFRKGTWGKNSMKRLLFWLFCIVILVTKVMANTTFC